MPKLQPDNTSLSVLKIKGKSERVDFSFVNYRSADVVLTSERNGGYRCGCGDFGEVGGHINFLRDTPLFFRLQVAIGIDGNLRQTVDLMGEVSD